MDEADFWQFLERSAQETTSRPERLAWLTGRLGEMSLGHVVDFQSWLDAARSPIGHAAMWEAVALIVGGFASDDTFWYFQPWLIAQGHRWWSHAAADPDNLADVPGVRALAGRPHSAWANDEWPQFELLDYVAADVYEQRTGVDDGLHDALSDRGLVARAGPAPSFDGSAALPRLTALFPPPR